MSLIYSAALIGVSLALLAGLVEAVWSISRKPRWGETRHSLSLVATTERRTQSMPFVGHDRRRDATADSTYEAEKLVA